MAIDSKIFKTRALTAIVFAAIMLVGLLWKAESFLILFTLIHFGSWYEFIKVIKKINSKTYGYYLPVGLLYISFPILMMIDIGFPNLNHYLYQTGYEDTFLYSPLFPCAIIFSIWINDTMAYIVGSMIGKTPFSKISPKKTWEGVIGGALLCIIVITLLGYFIPAAKSIAWYHWAFIAAICAVFGTLGDLLESKLKRMANIKDSGTLMPGHGGFLDRFDSMLVATPFVWLYVKMVL